MCFFFVSKKSFPVTFPILRDYLVLSCGKGIMNKKDGNWAEMGREGESWHAGSGFARVASTFLKNNSL